MDEPDVLENKIAILASLIKESKKCIVYSGAGISTSSGISDYASKSNTVVSGGGKVRVHPLLAQPTLAHKALVDLYRKGMVKHWVQQNHDGLPQKAGMPS